MAGANLQRIWQTEKQTYIQVIFAPYRPWLVASTMDGTITVWDIETQHEIVSIQVKELFSVQALAFNANGSRLAAGGGYFPTRMGSDYEVHVWDTTTWTELDYADTKRFDDMESVVFSPDGQFMAYGGQNGYMPICDALTGELLAPIYPQPNWVLSITFSPGSRYLAFQGDSNVQLWEIRQEPEFHLVLSHRWPEVDAMREYPERPLTSVIFSPDGQMLFAWLEADGSITVRDITTSEITTMLALENGPPTKVAFSPDAQLLAIADETGRVTLQEIDLADAQVQSSPPNIIP